MFKIFCDLDGTLTNFEKKFKSITGIHPDKFMEEKGEKEFWKVVDKEGDFWESLEWMPDGKQLWNFVKEYNPTILSSPGGNIEDCKEQKRKWVKDWRVSLLILCPKADWKKRREN